MEDFECKAPMYVNFVESSALNDNDGADEFFDCAETRAVCDTVKCESADVCAASETLCISVQSKSQEVVDATNIFADEQSEDHHHTEDEAKEGTPKDAYDIINLAMKNLWAASKQKSPEALLGKNISTLPQAKGQSLHCEEDHTQKTKVPLMIKNGKPKFISMAEAIRRFQRNTPDRFHSKPKTAKFISRFQPIKGITKTPHLALHLQAHPVHNVSSKDGRPAEEMKKLQVKTNPNVMELPKFDTRTGRKHRTESGSLVLTGEVGKVKDGAKCVTEKGHYFGIPTATIVEQKRRTKIQPFSFEERDRQCLKKKKETIQKYLEQEKKSREFRANPVPARIKASSAQKQGSGLHEMCKEGRELQQGAHFKAVPTTGIQREALNPKKADNSFNNRNSVLREQALMGKMSHRS